MGVTAILLAEPLMKLIDELRERLNLPKE